jgi:Pyruvate/2-oxoacid:ferredoxin oxidoreductase delta subunit
MSEVNPIYRKVCAHVRAEDYDFVPKVLSLMMTPYQAEILLTMPAADAAEVAGKLGRDIAEVEKDIQNLFEKGLVLFRKKGGMRTFYSVTELKDTTLSNPKFDDEFGPEFFDIWDKFFDSDEVAKWWYTMPIEEGQTIPLMRVLPKWQSIKDVPGVLPCDDVRAMLKEKSSGSLGLNNCSCRRVSRLHADPAIPEEICFVFDEVADYCVKRGTGRYVTYEEGLEVLDKLEKLTVVNVCYNDKKPLRLIGNCGPYCLIFRWSDKYDLASGAPSRFRAVVDPDKCCRGEQCAKCCLFDAVDVKYDPERERKRSHINPDKCWGCGNCVVQCPHQAIHMELVRPPEFIPDNYTGVY